MAKDKPFLAPGLPRAREEGQSGRNLFNRTFKQAREATGSAFGLLDVVASNTARGMKSMAHFTSDAVRGVMQDTSETAREVALAMARTFLGNATLTLYLPEMVLNNQIRKRIDQNSDIDHITVTCGNDRFKIRIDGHYQRALYTLQLDFNVLDCEIGQEKYLRLQQVNEKVDVYWRDGHTLSNWLTKKVSNRAFRLLNRLPVPSLINHIIRDIPGIQQEKQRIWHIDLEKAGFIDFLSNRSWMTEKLLSLTDFSILPGLNILRESNELLQQLVDQFEVRGLRVQNGRLEVQVGIDRMN